MFKKAVKHESKLRMAIAGPSGSGKTYTALSIASGLGENIALIDTEHGSASKYADIFDFDVLEISAPFHPDKFSDAILAAANAEYDVLIIDSLSHAWNGSGGILEIVNKVSVKYRGNSYAAWGEATPLQDRLVETIVSAGIHIIGTMRSKQDYILVEKNGKSVPQKVGMAPVQRDGFEYELDVFAEMDIDHNMIVTKSRCVGLADGVFSKPNGDVSTILKAWLSGEKLPEIPQDEIDFKKGNQATFFDLITKHISRYEGNEHAAKTALKKIGITSISKDWNQRFADYQSLKQYASYRNSGMDGDAALDALVNGTPDQPELFPENEQQPEIANNYQE